MGIFCVSVCIFLILPVCLLPIKLGGGEGEDSFFYVTERSLSYFLLPCVLRFLFCLMLLAITAMGSRGKHALTPLHVSLQPQWEPGLCSSKSKGVEPQSSHPDVVASRNSRLQGGGVYHSLPQNEVSFSLLCFPQHNRGAQGSCLSIAQRHPPGSLLKAKCCKHSLVPKHL